MSERQRPDGLAIAERVVAMALEAGASQAEAVIIDSHSALTRFANNEMHQNVAEDDTIVSLRYVDGKRIGVAFANRNDDDSLRDLTERAGTTARLQPEQEWFTSLPEPGPTPLAAGAWSAATAEADPDLRAEAAAAVIAAAEGVGAQAYGLVETGAETISVVNSLDIRVSEPRSRGRIMTVMMGPGGGTGYAEQVAVDVTQVDASSIGREAAQRTAAMRDPIELPAGDYPVVLDSYATMDVALWLGLVGFGAQDVQEQQSFYERGKVVASPLVSLADDGTEPQGAPASFDLEGVAKQRVPLLSKGVCDGIVYDSKTAARDDRRSTGHALRAPNPWGPYPFNLSMAAGETPRDEVIGGMERGLLVTRFHYTNVVQPKQVTITGMTKDGLFLVEDGKITAPVRNLRFTQSYLDALAAVEAVSIERRTVDGDDFLGTIVVPTLRIGSFSFTGTTVDA
jgi:predicted Zn-dependent protease